MAIAESGAAKWGHIMRSTVTFLGGTFAFGLSLVVAAPVAAQTADGTSVQAQVKSPEQIRYEKYAKKSQRLYDYMIHSPARIKYFDGDVKHETLPY